MTATPVRRWARSAGHLTLGAGLAVAAWAVWHHRSAYRGHEASVAAAVSHLALHTPTFGSIPNATFFLGVGSPHAFGLVVTNDCTSAITTTVVLAVTAILALVSRTGIGRLAAAAVVASATFAAINLARLVMIAAATRQWGLGAGFHWSHVWGGTFVTVLGSVVTAVAYLHVLGMRRHPERPRPTPSSPDRTA